MESAISQTKRCCRSLTLCICFSCCSLSLNAQFIQDTIVSYFNTLGKFPQEKLYLHLDKPFYGAGENIWFKGYLQNAISHKSDAMSNFIITELINRNDSIIQRQKIRRDSIGFRGNLTLPAELPEGNYYLRAYSNWMLNEDEDFFYSRNIKIGNSIDIDILSAIEYQQESEKSYVGKIRFTNQGNTPLQDTKIRYILSDGGKRIDRGTLTTDKDGIIRVKLPNLRDNNNHRRLDVSFDNNSQYKYSKSFYLPNLSTDYEVTFFPEGGELLNTTTQIVAFKAQGANGLSKDISGIVLNNSGDTLSVIKTEHDGMGLFNMTPLDGESYHVETISSDGVRKRFELPVPKEQGFAISLTAYRKEIRYNIQKTPNTPWPNTLFLIVHTRGDIYILKKINPDSTGGKIDENILKEGISHFLVVDENGIPLTERLFFVRHDAQPQWKITPDKESYQRREKVTVAVSAIGKDGLPVSGDFSVSITDAGSVRPDSLYDTILSNLLLTSDLKGYIENPGHYFLSTDKKYKRDLDLLMLTHGWKRFNISNLKEKPQIKTDHYIEIGQTISGKIKGLFGGKVKNAPIIALAPTQNITKTVMTNDKGEFLIDGIGFPDSTTFIIQARTKRGFAGVDILIDSTDVPKPVSSRIYPNDSIRFMDDYLINTREKYYYEGGMRVINLKEVVIQAERKKTTSSNSIYTGMSDHTVSSEKLDLLTGQTVFDIVSRMPGIRVSNGNQIQIRGSNTPPIVVINGVIYEDDDSILESVNVSDIEQIDVLKGANASIFGMRGGGGAIVIELKSGKEVSANWKPSPGILTISPMGYSKSAEFYHPKYDTPQKKSNPQPDLRTTLYWNPSLVFNPEGKAVIEYYTSDNSTSQYIVIEGVDINGNVYRYSGKLN